MKFPHQRNRNQQDEDIAEEVGHRESVRLLERLGTLLVERLERGPVRFEVCTAGEQLREEEGDCP